MAQFLASAAINRKRSTLIAKSALGAAVEHRANRLAFLPVSFLFLFFFFNATGDL